MEIESPLYKINCGSVCCVDSGQQRIVPWKDCGVNSQPDLMQSTLHGKRTGAAVARKRLCDLTSFGIYDPNLYHARLNIFDHLPLNQDIKRFACINSVSRFI